MGLEGRLRANLDDFRHRPGEEEAGQPATEATPAVCRRQSLS
jgi:hypothetical protein